MMLLTLKLLVVCVWCSSLDRRAELRLKLAVNEIHYESNLKLGFQLQRDECTGIVDGISEISKELDRINDMTEETTMLTGLLDCGWQLSRLHWTFNESFEELSNASMDIYDVESEVTAIKEGLTSLTDEDGLVDRAKELLRLIEEDTEDAKTIRYRYDKEIPSVALAVQDLLILNMLLYQQTIEKQISTIESSLKDQQDIWTMYEEMTIEYSKLKAVRECLDSLQKTLRSYLKPELLDEMPAIMPLLLQIYTVSQKPELKDQMAMLSIGHDNFCPYTFRDEALHYKHLIDPSNEDPLCYLHFCIGSDEIIKVCTTEENPLNLASILTLPLLINYGKCTHEMAETSLDFIPYNEKEIGCMQSPPLLPTIECIDKHVKDGLILNVRGLRALRGRIFNQFVTAIKGGYVELVVVTFGCDRCKLNVEQVGQLYKEAIDVFKGKSVKTIYFIDSALYKAVIS